MSTVWKRLREMAFWRNCLLKRRVQLEQMYILLYQTEGTSLKCKFSYTKLKQKNPNRFEIVYANYYLFIYFYIKKIWNLRQNHIITIINTNTNTITYKKNPHLKPKRTFPFPNLKPTAYHPTHAKPINPKTPQPTTTNTKSHDPRRPQRPTWPSPPPKSRFIGLCLSLSLSLGTFSLSRFVYFGFLA